MILQSKRILIVEDENLVAMEIAHEVTALGAKVVAMAGSVDSALKVIETKELDGAILDIKLGDEMSFRVADALAARHIPFVFLSGYPAASMTALVVEARHENIKCFQKPWGPNGIRKALEAIIHA
jgi:CheY-like chemotaxis protein